MGPRYWTTWIALLAVSACGGGEADHSGPGGRTPDLSDAYAYVADSPWASDLVQCVDARREPSSCSIGQLPPIGRAAPAPNVEDVMDHVVVSHDWMGARFREILEREPSELLRLLGAATAIVIDDDVRPSFYWSLTGAVYVDPRHLWLTAEEEATIGDEADYRSGFGAALGFFSFSSYLDADGPAFVGSGPERDLDSRVAAVAALLFHEGAHANDFLPPAELDRLDPEEPFVDVVERLEGSRLSPRLAAWRPLDSELWRGLGRVLYFGEEATNEQEALTAAQVGAAFEPDGASDPYSYSAQQEDFAMLFEETMLKRHFDFDRRVGFATAPDEPAQSCEDYVVGWGVRSRIAAASVAPRAQRVAELLLGDPLTSFFAALPRPIPIPPGEDLCVERSMPPETALRWR